MVVNIIVTGLLLIISGVAKSVKDTVSHHFYTSIFRNLNPKFWEAGGSWLNKYKTPDLPLRPRFWGSTTFLAWTTDAFHLFDTIQTTAWQTALTLQIMYANHLKWYVGIVVLLCIKALVSIPFEATYSKLFIKK